MNENTLTIVSDNGTIIIEVVADGGDAIEYVTHEGEVVTHDGQPVWRNEE